MQISDDEVEPTQKISEADKKDPNYWNIFFIILFYYFISFNICLQKDQGKDKKPLKPAATPAKPKQPENTFKPSASTKKVCICLLNFFNINIRMTPSVNLLTAATPPLTPKLLLLKPKKQRLVKLIKKNQKKKISSNS